MRSSRLGLLAHGGALVGAALWMLARWSFEVVRCLRSPLPERCVALVEQPRVLFGLWWLAVAVGVVAGALLLARGHRVQGGIALALCAAVVVASATWM